jgi:hypothetical protein
LAKCNVLWVKIFCVYFEQARHFHFPRIANKASCGRATQVDSLATATHARSGGTEAVVGGARIPSTSHRPLPAGIGGWASAPRQI